MAHGSKSSRNKATTATGRVIRVVQIRRRSVRRILGPAAIAQQKLSNEREQRLRYEGTSVYSSHTPLGNKAFLFVELNTEEQRALQALRDIPEEAGLQMIGRWRVKFWLATSLSMSAMQGVNLRQSGIWRKI